MERNDLLSNMHAVPTNGPGHQLSLAVIRIGVVIVLISLITSLISYMFTFFISFLGVFVRFDIFQMISFVGDISFWLVLGGTFVTGIGYVWHSLLIKSQSGNSFLTLGGGILIISIFPPLVNRIFNKTPTSYSEIGHFLAFNYLALGIGSIFLLIGMILIRKIQREGPAPLIAYAGSKAVFGFLMALFVPLFLFPESPSILPGLFLLLLLGLHLFGIISWLYLLVKVDSLKFLQLSHSGVPRTFGSLNEGYGSGKLPSRPSAVVSTGKSMPSKIGASDQHQLSKKDVIRCPVCHSSFPSAEDYIFCVECGSPLK